jgi:predicted DCC family thiol-disulfide oxidoreductase YuxK
MNLKKKIVFIDGKCLLCQSSVLFILKRDYKSRFVFVPLESSLAKQLLQNNNNLIDSAESIILWESGKIHKYSTAALRIFKNLNCLWPLLYILIIVPPFVRDKIYILIAKNRYYWFGKSDICMIPPREWMDRFPISISELDIQ